MFFLQVKGACEAPRPIGPPVPLVWGFRGVYCTYQFYFRAGVCLSPYLSISLSLSLRGKRSREAFSPDPSRANRAPACHGRPWFPPRSFAAEGLGYTEDIPPARCMNCQLPHHARLPHKPLVTKAPTEVKRVCKGCLVKKGLPRLIPNSS